MPTVHRNFLIEGGPLLDQAKGWRAERGAVRDAWFAFAKETGAQGYYEDSMAFGDKPSSLFALTAVHPVPKGWRLGSKRDRMIPRKDAKELRARMDALPKMPNTNALISAAISWPRNLNAKGWSEGLPWCQLCWAGDDFLIAVPLSGLFGNPSAAAAEHAMAFPVPEGCREITEAQWELIMARYKVSCEAA